MRSWGSCKPSEVLDAVETWAGGMVLIREIGGLVDGRLDGLLVPVGRDAPMMNLRAFDEQAEYDYFFERCGLVGVEVKVERSDWLRGLKSGQLSKYLASGNLSGIYVAAPHGVVKPDEIPDGVGHLVIRSTLRRPAVCSCRRHPTWVKTVLRHAVLWRLLFKMRDLELARERKRVETEYRRMEKIKDRVAGMVAGPLAEIQRKVKAEMEAEPC